jgi:hypothetical protein
MHIQCTIFHGKKYYENKLLISIMVNLSLLVMFSSISQSLNECIINTFLLSDGYSVHILLGL